MQSLCQLCRKAFVKWITSKYFGTFRCFATFSIFQKLIADILVIVPFRNTSRLKERGWSDVTVFDGVIGGCAARAFEESITTASSERAGIHALQRVLERAIFYERSGRRGRTNAYGKKERRHPRSGNETGIPSGSRRRLHLHLAPPSAPRGR